MRVLLTGANGFVGSHILDELCQRGIETAILLRSTSSTSLISQHLNHVEIIRGSLDDISSLRKAVEKITHIIHCAGLVRALDPAEFFKANRDGAQNLVSAVNSVGKNVERFILFSSLAASGPSSQEQPRREEDEPSPISYYGESKLAGEKVVISQCKVNYTILRPPAVYGPRDMEFFRLFKAVKSHILPIFGGGKQPLSLVYVKDLASIAVETLFNSKAIGKIYFVANPEFTTALGLANAIKEAMNVWTVPLCLPVQGLYPICLCQEIISKVTKKPSMLDRQKYKELSATGWTCDVSKIKNELGLVCKTSLKQGAEQTAQWYYSERWLK